MPDIKGAGEGAASKGKGALTHKVGPLPLWGWAVAGVAAVIVVKKFSGGGGGGAPGSFGITPVGPAPYSPPTVPGTPPITPGAGGVPGVAMPQPPSTNGSPGTGPAAGNPKGAPPAAGSWWTKLINPAGNLPAGASATTIGGTIYSLSAEALARAGIPGASAPTAPAVAATGTTAASGVDTSGNTPFYTDASGKLQQGRMSAYDRING